MNRCRKVFVFKQIIEIRLDEYRELRIKQCVYIIRLITFNKRQISKNNTNSWYEIQKQGSFSSLNHIFFYFKRVIQDTNKDCT